VSLLLDALKKAEKAKEAAQRGDIEADAPRESGLSLEPTPEDAKRVMTRDKLPDISTPLEIGSDDLSPRQSAARVAGTPPAAAEPNRRSQTAAPAAPARPAARHAQGNPVAQRAAAQSVFEAKFKEPNPRLPFYVAMGALGAFAIGTIVYFWIQLRPPPPLVNASPRPPAGEQPVETAKAPAAVPGVPQSETGPGQAIPGLPGVSAAPATGTPSAQTAPAAVSATAPSTKPPAEEARPVLRSEPVASVARAPATTTRTPRAEASSPVAAQTSAPRSFGRRTVARVNPGVAAGYAAYQSGDLAGARRGYDQALRAEPKNIDALLGMAAVELRVRQYALADRYYQQVLRLDPRNPHAHAGMLALRNQQIDPVTAESQVKSLIAHAPRAEGLQFTLGNQYAQQGRWDEAQQAYFKALAADPNNPDFAYNLAVSLDHLRQVKPALQHYKLALKLAANRGAGFDSETVRVRVAQLEH